MTKKIGALALALIMVLAMGATAWADSINNSNTSDAPTLATSNDTGVAGTWTEKDVERVDTARKINIVKEITSYNAIDHAKDSNPVYAPLFSYVYTVTPAVVTDNTTVTDEATDHISNTAVTAPVKAGITNGLKVAGNTTVGTSENAVGYLDFTNSTPLAASVNGSSNTYNIELDFSGVSFSQSGVYRYQIAETITKPDHTTTVNYDEVAMKDATGTNANTRWLDVYVDGDGKIYGYVCMAANDSVTSSTTKTNGFVNGSGGDDKYYTYDLELSKTVVNDTFGKNHDFPFTVIFNNTEKYTSTFAITDSSESNNVTFTASNGTDANVAWSKVEKIKHDGKVTYTGIPAGIDVDVYETNDVNGVTYKVDSSVNSGTATTDTNVNWTTTTPATATAQANTKNSYESTKVTVDTAKIDTVSQKQTVAITNTLLQISPTGVVLRIAPYALILGAGIALLIISRRRKASNEEE